MKCQICNGESRLVFLKEKNVSCGDYFDGKRLYERNLGATPLLECRNCGFAYFSEMHGWTENKYRIEIYNENYGLCDPPFKEARPRKLAAWLSNILEPVDLIDFGGGEGQLAGLLVGKGFNARCYDPFYGPRQLPNGDAEVVTAFEVVEHVPDQRPLFRSLKGLCRSGGKVVFSTLLKDKYLGGDWWYSSPRNGHVSFHTRDSLGRIMGDLGLEWLSLSPEMHVCSVSRDALADATEWKSVSVSGTPAFLFDGGWSKMRPIKVPEITALPRANASQTYEDQQAAE